MSASFSSPRRKKIAGKGVGNSYGVRRNRPIAAVSPKSPPPISLAIPQKQSYQEGIQDRLFAYGSHRALHRFRFLSTDHEIRKKVWTRKGAEYPQKSLLISKV
jgi:hypothetical protein